MVARGPAAVSRNLLALAAEAGKDSLKGGPGNDKLKGGAGEDVQIQ